MQLFNAGTFFTKIAQEDVMSVANDPEAFKEKLIEIKLNILKAFHLQVLNLPQDFTKTSYVIASNHLTDADAPLFMSYYYQLMHSVLKGYPQLFVFAKENCFNGVSIPKQFLPVLDTEKVIAVDRTSAKGSMEAIKVAEKWFAEGEKPRHFLLFAQGTIYDINKDKAEDIERGAFWLARKLGIPVLPAFIEQAVEGEENRLIFGEPISIPKTCRNLDEPKQLWLERVISAQNKLKTLTGVPAREAMLDAEHQTRKRFKNK